MLPNGSAAHSPETPLISDVDADAEFLRLAGLSVLSYGRERKDASEKLRLPVAWLDKVVNAKKAEIIAEAGGGGEADSGGQGRPINLPEPKPWPHPVDGADLLSAVTATISKYMVMEPGAAGCAAMWGLHTHSTEAVRITP